MCRSWLLVPVLLLAAAVLWADEPLTNNRYKDWAPTVSPDGKTVLFLSKRTTQDIWRLDVATRKLSRITDDALRERHVRFSPDGRRFAYLVVRGLDTFVVVRSFPDGQPREMGRGDDLAWSPDGKWLASRDATGIFLLNPTTGAPTRLAAASRAAPGSMAWRRSDGALLVLDEGDIYAIGREKRHPQKLYSSKTEDARANFKTFAIAPDGKHIVAVLDLGALALRYRDEGILLGGEKRRRLGHLVDPIWRDGRTLLFSREGSIHEMTLDGQIRTIAGESNVAAEPVLSRADGWLYFSARQPQRRRAGGRIQAKYSEIYRVRLTH